MASGAVSRRVWDSALYGLWNVTLWSVFPIVEKLRPREGIQLPGIDPSLAEPIVDSKTDL